MSAAAVPAPARPGAPRLALAVAILLGIALAVVIAVAPRGTCCPTPAGGRIARSTRRRAFTPAQTARAEDFAAALRPASLASLRTGPRRLRRSSGSPGPERPPPAPRPAAGRGLGLAGAARRNRDHGGRPAGRAAAGRLRRDGPRTGTGCPPESWGLWARDVAVSYRHQRRADRAGHAGARRRSPGVLAAVVVGVGGRRRGRASCVAGSFLCPVLIEPVFNRFNPMPGGAAAHGPASRWPRADGMPVQDVLVADASRRTTALNAYVSGFGADPADRRLRHAAARRAARREIESIVAHELGPRQDRRRRSPAR